MAPLDFTRRRSTSHGAAAPDMARLDRNRGNCRNFSSGAM
jgi:hypothetical protein